MIPKPCAELQDILRPGLGPCPEFAGACRGAMRWAPAEGHIPRGCCGAFGRREDVELVMIVAEPGDPHPEESYPENATPDEYLSLFTEHAFLCFSKKHDQFHVNARHFLDLCFPRVQFPAQLQRVWITESCLCSAAQEGGPVPTCVTRCCAQRYLAPQLALFPNAAKVAFGRKAQARTRHLGFDIIPAGALAPPGCNQAKVKQSWADAAAQVRHGLLS